MEKYSAAIEKCPLFKNIEAKDIPALLNCLSAVKRQYDKNQPIYAAGEAVDAVGVVLSGNVHVTQEDFWGNRSILANIEAGGLFAEAFSWAGVDKIPVSVAAARPSVILMLDYGKIASSCSAACVFHGTLIKNMLNILAAKNIELTQKIEVLSKRSTRKKLLAYLSAQARQAGGPKFTIPFNRQALADYLSVDRSAMSAELSKMQGEGILKRSKNEFELLLEY